MNQALIDNLSLEEKAQYGIPFTAREVNEFLDLDAAGAACAEAEAEAAEEALAEARRQVSWAADYVLRARKSMEHAAWRARKLKVLDDDLEPVLESLENINRALTLAQNLMQEI